MQEGNVRGYDVTNPAEVKAKALEQPAELEMVPKSILNALARAVLGVLNAHLTERGTQWHAKRASATGTVCKPLRSAIDRGFSNSMINSVHNIQVTL